MDQFREPYLQMPKDYTGKMPFYLTYPMPNVYQTEKEYERDMERMKELYPRRKSQDKSANLWKKNVTKWNTKEA